MTATVEQIESWIVDVPTIRPHKLSMTTMGCQSLVIVRLTRSDGICGIGEATTIGGLSYGVESPEAISSAITHYLTPLLKGQPADNLNALTARMTDAQPFPYIVLLVSGGHTQLLEVRGVGDYRRLGSTIDDAIGEAFDKVGKLLGLPYPGGPNVEKTALDGDPERFALPRPMFGRPDPDFSLSGLKTAVRNEATKIAPLTRTDIADLCASFQAAVVDVIIDRTRAALRVSREGGSTPSALVVAGGVAANGAIRRALTRFCGEAGLKLVTPPPELCTDNGAMVAWVGIERLELGMTDDLTIAARPRWPLDTRTSLRHHGKA